MQHLLQNTSIVKKMAGALLIMVLLALLLSGFAIHKLSTINSHTLAMQEKWLVSIRVLGQIKGLLAEGKYNVISHLQTSSSAGARRVENKFRSDAETLQGFWKDYLKVQHDEKEQPLSSKFMQDYEAYLLTVDNVLNLSRDHSKEEARILFLNTTLPAIIEAQDSLNQLIEYHSNRAASTVQTANQIHQQAWKQVIALFILITGFGYGLLRLIQRTFLQPVLRQTQTLSLLAAGKSDTEVSDTLRHDEIGDMARALQQLKTAVAQQQESAWIKTQVANITGTLQSQHDLGGFAEQLLEMLAPLLGAQVATFYYQAPQQPFFECIGSYCLPHNHTLQRFAMGEGLVGQCAVNQQNMLIHDIPNQYLNTESGTLTIPAQTLRLLPIIFPNVRVAAVMEFAFLTEMPARCLPLLEEMMPRIAMQLQILERQTAMR